MRSPCRRPRASAASSALIKEPTETLPGLQPGQGASAARHGRRSAVARSKPVQAQQTEGAPRGGSRGGSVGPARSRDPRRPRGVALALPGSTTTCTSRPTTSSRSSTRSTRRTARALERARPGPQRLQRARRGALGASRGERRSLRSGNGSTKRTRWRRLFVPRPRSPAPRSRRIAIDALFATCATVC